MRERVYQQAADAWLYEDYDEPEDYHEPEDEAERQARAAEQTTFRPQLKAMAERVTATRRDADHA